MKARHVGIGLAAVVAVIGLFVGGMYWEHRPPEEGRNILTTDGSEGVKSFQIASEAGEVLWRIEASPARPLEKLHYRDVPTGFRQVVPGVGSPRLFRKGESLKTEVMMPTRQFIHSGVALDETRFQGGVYTSGPWRHAGA